LNKSQCIFITLASALLSMLARAFHIEVKP
jgi:hypothetical protein